MKIRVFLAAFFVFTFGLSQDYKRVDATIQLYPKQVNNAEELSKFISRDFTTQEDKVRAIYSWIINNITYDPNEYKKFNYNFKNYRERNQKEEKTRKQIIKRTLQKSIAVCEGYAMVFERLCELQNINSYLVRGDTKSTFTDIGRPFQINHMWNVAMIDGKPFLFDPTWGAGKYQEKFIKDPSYYYYKTPPKQFFKTHYPDQYEDAFMDQIITSEEFSILPLIIEKKIIASDIETPHLGILYEKEYFNDIPFTINNLDPKQISYSYGKTPKEVDFKVLQKGRIQFNIPLEIGAKKLLIYFDGKPALAYQIK